MRRWISRLPQWARPFAWVAATPFLILGWMMKEMAGQAKAGAKKALAPLLWPAAAIGFGLLLYAAVGPEAFESILLLFLAVGGMAYGLKLMVFGFSKPKKKKK